MTCKESYYSMVFLWLTCFHKLLWNFLWLSCFHRTPYMTFYDFPVFCTVVNPGSCKQSNNSLLKSCVFCDSILSVVHFRVFLLDIFGSFGGHLFVVGLPMWVHKNHKLRASTTQYNDLVFHSCRFHLQLTTMSDYLDIIKFSLILQFGSFMISGWPKSGPFMISGWP